MSRKNTSDLIEEYLKKLLNQASEIEIKRSELAETFDVVPSQINYVIKTRFTLLRGYEVLSKRGGGGYIRIVKIRCSNRHLFLQEVQDKIPDLLSEKATQDIIQFLFEEKIISFREGNLMLSVLSDSNFNSKDADATRSLMVKSFLQRLDREDEIK
ncbi:CtsR family transcriptional regulator [Streptococcaceae bacterium ESL0687]|nr:CtsR family transcriptional regulator [Streptococcaceae bacterium ESL0687]